MITEKIIQRVQSLYSKGVQSDDSRLKSRHIYNKLLTVRSKILSQKANKRQMISQWNFQTIPCVVLEKAPKHECPCAPPMGCDIYRTKEVLPEPLTNLNGHMIQSVTSIEGSTVYDEIGWTEAKYKAGNKYTAMKPDYFIRNKYLYVIQVKGASVIAITGLFEDPFAATTYPSDCGDCTDCENDCDSPMDLDFPIDNDLIDTMVEIAAQELIFVFTQGKEDKDNNTSDDTSRPQRQVRQPRNAKNR
ncbi:MAG: hypothetical protein KUG81_05315 [Gammaproteobacteria bacterium]|nr:hypothetical protein [Gammaproteobacteria bacterium]